MARRVSISSVTSTPQPIELLVRVVIVVDGKLLLCRGRGAKISYLPGGHIDPGESAREAARREIEEELGLSAVVGRFLGAVEHTFEQKGTRIHELNVLFQATVAGLKSDTPPPSREDWIGFEWAPLAALDAARLEPAPLRTLLPQWLEGSAGWASTMEM